MKMLSAETKQEEKARPEWKEGSAVTSILSEFVISVGFRSNNRE